MHDHLKQGKSRYFYVFEVMYATSGKTQRISILVTLDGNRVTADHVIYTRSVIPMADLITPFTQYCNIATIAKKSGQFIVMTAEQITLYS